ncbi:MAG: M20/M25/M40 family metallo-hydrolase [Coriobacteriia bacterium]|nr:M20/M25/M40 family metallo-hydrolase [Coriobacteriia bacterium]
MVAINKARLLATFLELVQIDSPAGQEAEVAAYCRQALEGAGCEISAESDREVPGSNTGNVIALLPAFPEGSQHKDTKPLYFSAHMDSVEPCLGIKPHIDEGVIYSDGTTVLGGDDKVGLAAIIEMIRCLAEMRQSGSPHPEVRVLFTVQEETGLFGAKALDQSQFDEAQGALCYVLDAAGKPGLIVNGAPCQHSYQAVFTGVAAHAGIAPEKGASAIHVAAQAVAALKQGRLDEQSTSNVGTIKGGTANNVVAAECVVTGELRSQSKKQLMVWRDYIEKTINSVAMSKTNEAGAVKVSIEWEVNYEEFFAPEDSPQVELALRAAQSLGIEARAERGNGGADTNVLASYGLAAVSLGSGMDRVHSTEECLAVADLENLARLALGIVQESLT